MGRTLNEMLASRSVDSQQRIQEMANELLLEVRLQALREELEVSRWSWPLSSGSANRPLWRWSSVGMISSYPP